MKVQSFLSIIYPAICAVTLVACGGSTPHPENYTRHEIDDSACRTVYEPVCALAEEGDQYRYQTFGNRCVADLEGAEITFEADCDALEGQTSKVSQPIVVQESPKQLPPSSDAILLDSEITQDVAHLTLEHGGCPGAEYRFELHVASDFMESVPPQVNARLAQKRQPEADCMALISTDVSIDLLPLKNLYHMSYDSDTGEILIPYAGLYQF